MGRQFTIRFHQRGIPCAHVGLNFLTESRAGVHITQKLAEITAELHLLPRWPAEGKRPVAEEYPQGTVTARSQFFITILEIGGHLMVESQDGQFNVRLVSFESLRVEVDRCGVEADDALTETASVRLTFICKQITNKLVFPLHSPTCRPHPLVPLNYVPSKHSHNHPLPHLPHLGTLQYCHLTDSSVV